MISVNTDTLRVAAAFGATLMFYYLLSLFGYGTDCDTYLMIRTGQQALSTFVYMPSRPPGYFVPEMIIGITSLLGAFYLSNLVSAIMGTFALFLFWRLLKNYLDSTTAVLIVLVVGLNPYYIIAASSSMDYIYSLFLIMCGIALLDKRWYLASAPCFAMAISCRLSNVLIVGAIYLFLLYIHFRRTDRRDLAPIAKSIGIASVLGGLLYIPSFIAYDYSLAFLTYSVADWSVLEHLYRFIYKNAHLLGLLPLIIILTSSFYSVVRRHRHPRVPFVTLGIVIVVLQEVLFFKIPAEISYLLPLLFIVVPLWAIAIRQKRSVVVTVLVLTIVCNVAKFDILDIKYDAKTREAVAADVGVFVKRGSLMTDLMDRGRSQEFFFREYGLSPEEPSFTVSYRQGAK